MHNYQSETDEQILKSQQLTLLELLDRLLDKGVMAKGEILLSVADIDLVYLNLGLLLSSVKTVEHTAHKRRPSREPEKWPTQPLAENEVSQELRWSNQENRVETVLPSREDHAMVEGETLSARTLPQHIEEKPAQTSEPRANIDPKKVEKGLAKLVLTLVDLIRKLMEKQAIRRIEADQLSEQEIEKVGNAFFILDEKMEELKEVFGLKGEDLNLDLGPLGDLL